MITPSVFTRCIASAINLPIASSPFAEIFATCSIFSNLSPTASAWLAMLSTTLATALSIPRFKSIGFAPAVTFFKPTPMIDWAKTVAVVVPSPALSFVLEATSLTNWAPMFSNGQVNSTSLATVTPSFVMWGAPNFFSIITLRPFGPNVTLTALANSSTPFFKRSRASISYLISFAMIVSLFNIVVYKNELDNS